jgi:hypothetical protein
MPTPKPKTNSKPKPKPKAKPATERSTVESTAASGEPFLRFHHSQALRKKTLVVLEKLEAAPDPTQHRMALADVVVELTRAGMDAYFMQPLRTSKAGFITEQSAGLGMAGAVQVIASVMRNIVGSMGAPQLLSVCQSLRQFMR